MTSHYADTSSIGLAMWAAGENGIAPRVHAHTAIATVSDWLAEPWKRARLNDLVEPDLRGAVLAQHRRFQHLTVPGLASRNVIDDVFRLRDLCVKAGAVLPLTVDALLRDLAPFIARASTFAEPAVPCHSDGATSNVIYRSSADVLLTGWTLAARRDPLQEVGSLLAELVPHCLSAEELIVAMGYSLNDDIVLVVRCHAILDGLQWALMGFLNSVSAEDQTVDYFKYASWRLINAQSIAQTPDVTNWIGDLTP
jgi:hypothetical protein